MSQREHPCYTSPVMKGNIVTNLETTTVSPFSYLHPFLLNANWYPNFMIMMSLFSFVVLTPKQASPPLNTVIFTVFNFICPFFPLASLISIKFVKLITTDVLYFQLEHINICKYSEKDVKGYMSYWWWGYISKEGTGSSRNFEWASRALL